MGMMESQQQREEEKVRDEMRLSHTCHDGGIVISENRHPVTREIGAVSKAK